MHNKQFESEVYFKLLEAEREAEHTDKIYSSKEVFENIINCREDRFYNTEDLV